MKHHLIYVPGLGDRFSYGQDIAINFWRFYGFSPHYLALKWRKNDGMEVKLDKIFSKIDELSRNGSKVSLVGASAGASAVLNAYAKRKSLTSVIYICGKINRPEAVGTQIYQVNPDFKRSLAVLKGNVDSLSAAELSKILNLHPVTDQTVAPADTQIAGVTEQIVPGRTHATGIFAGIIFGAPKIAKFIRSLEA